MDQGNVKILYQSGEASTTCKRFARRNVSTLAPGFAVAFLPGETFFSAALRQDPELTQYGVRIRVLLATPATLIGVPKAAAQRWRQEKLARSAQEIPDPGKELFCRLRTFVARFDAWIDLSVKAGGEPAGPS